MASTRALGWALWALLGITLLYEVIVFIFVWLSLIGVSEGAAFATPVAIKWMLLAAAIVDLLVWALAAFLMRLPWRPYTWHFGLSVWFFAFASIGAFWWNSQYSNPLFDAGNVRPYILWKAVLGFAAVMGTLTVLTAVIAIVMTVGRIRLSKRRGVEM
jgi:hypothetical protein